MRPTFLRDIASSCRGCVVASARLLKLMTLAIRLGHLYSPLSSATTTFKLLYHRCWFLSACTKIIVKMVAKKPCA